MNVEQKADPFGLNAQLRAASAPPAVKTGSRHHPWRWILGILIVLVIAVRIALNPVATIATRRALENIKGYEATLESVKVSIIPLTFTITNLKMEQEGAKTEEPALFVREATGQLFWRKLIKLQAVATASLDHLKFVIAPGKTRPPPEAEAEAKEQAEKAASGDFDLAVQLQQLIPFRVDRIQVTDSEVLVLDPKIPSAKLWVSQIELAVENLVTRRNLDENVPVNLTMRAVVAKTGIVKVLVTADLLERLPSFTGEAQLSGLKLSSLYPVTSAKAGISARGTADVFANFNSAKGELRGDVKVILSNAHVMPADEKLSDSLKAKAANAAISVLSDRVEDRDAIATNLPIKGSLKNPDPQIWPTILGVVRNAFVQGLDWGFSDLPAPTASKPEGPVDQAAKALDKNEPAPKAQPEGK